MARSRSKANGEGTIYKEMRKGKPYYKGTLTIGYDENGKLIRKSFCGFKKQDVINKMAEFKTKNNSGLLPSDDKITLQQWFYTWLFEFRINDLKPSSFERYEGIYRNYIKDTPLGKKKLANIRTNDLQHYYNSLLNQSKTPSNVRTLNKYLCTCLNAAVKQGYIVKNYCSMTTLPKVESKSEITVFTVHEQQEFIASIANHRLKALFLVALGSGLRLGELLALKWADIDFEDRTLSITKAIKQVTKIGKDGTRKWINIEQTPKTESSIRTIPLPTNIINELVLHKERQDQEKLNNEELYQDNNRIFCTELGNIIDTRNLTRAYTRALKRANIQYKKFHSLRHTYATRLFENDVSIKTVQSLMGHKDITTTMNIYTHVMPEKMANDVEKINDLFF